MKDTKRISLILCSRNDQYMGNSVWRLQTAVNFAASELQAAGHLDDAEILISDWGSDVPLQNVLQLSPAAIRITRFVWISPELARRKQKDSKFPEVLAHNATIRRARGEYIGRIDQDTLVGRGFIKKFFALMDGQVDYGFLPQKAFLFAMRRMIPYEFSVRCGSFRDVVRFIGMFRRILPVEKYGYRPWFNAPTGICILHRDLWMECGGYDERLIYWGWMETDLAYRIEKKYPLINLTDHLGCEFYHLEHVAPKEDKRTARKRNCDIGFDKLSEIFSPNDASWGCVDEVVAFSCSEAPEIAEPEAARISLFAMIASIWVCWIRMVIFPLAYRATFPKWMQKPLDATRALRGRLGLRGSQFYLGKFDKDKK